MILAYYDTLRINADDTVFTVKMFSLISTVLALSKKYIFLSYAYL